LVDFQAFFKIFLDFSWLKKFVPKAWRSQEEAVEE